jgi:hypothetical protein
LDFVTLDYSSVRFSPSVLAATTLFLFAESQLDVVRVTGFSIEHLKPCMRWMSYFAIILDQFNAQDVDRPLDREVGSAPKHIPHLCL